MLRCPGYAESPEHWLKALDSQIGHYAGEDLITTGPVLNKTWEKEAEDLGAASPTPKATLGYASGPRARTFHASLPQFPNPGTILEYFSSA